MCSIVFNYTLTQRHLVCKVKNVTEVFNKTVNSMGRSGNSKVQILETSSWKRSYN